MLINKWQYMIINKGIISIQEGGTMGKFNIIVFDGLNLDNYETVETDLEHMLEDIEKLFGHGGYSTDTSSWMNRFPILEDGEKTYILVPSTIPSCNDVVKATVGRYAILLLHDDDGYLPFTEEDIKFFKENLIKQFDIKERKRRERETKEAYEMAALKDAFRVPLMICNDDTVEIIRFLITNKMTDLFKTLVDASIFYNDESIQNIYKLVTCDPRLKDNITISAEDFSREIFLFFRPEVHFAHLNISIEKGISTYYSLCEEGWLRETFLAISEKEHRELFKEFLKGNHLP